MSKEIIHHIRVSPQDANRLEIDRNEKGYDSISEQYEKIIWYYLSHEAGSETERRQYQEKIIAQKISMLNNAMREDNKQGIINNIVEILVRLFLYKRVNLNKSRTELYTLELFKLLDLIRTQDKILFDEIMCICKSFGIKSNKFRCFNNESVISDKGSIIYKDTTTKVNKTIEV